MQMNAKAQIAGATLTAFNLVASLFFIGILVFVLCAGLQINPFKESTASFLLAPFLGLIGIATIPVLLMASGKIEDLQRIYEIRRLLSSQRKNLPNLDIIYCGNFSGRIAGINCLWPGNPAAQASQQVLMPYVTFGV